MNTETLSISFRDLRSKETSDRIRAGERLILKDGARTIAEIVPLEAPRQSLAGLKDKLRVIHQEARAKKQISARNLILEDRERFRR